MRIERDIIQRLKLWKVSPNRKPILLKGARQIGKSWVMETFGQECFEYLNASSRNLLSIASNLLSQAKH